MFLPLAFLGAAFVAGHVLLVMAIRNAPQGFEDENGFQITWSNNSPDRQDVACIWLPATSAAIGAAMASA